MKFKLLLSLTIFGITISASTPVTASPLQATIDAAAPLCLPGVDLMNTDDCQLSGPSGYILAMEDQGVVLPLNPLPAVYIDAAYSELPFNYVRLSEDAVPIFSSLDDATRNNNPYRSISTGPTKYVSYIDYSSGNGRAKYYMIEPGMWIRGGSTTGRVAASSYVGMQFSGTPERQFGWVIYQTESYKEPGSDTPAAGHTLFKYDPIQVYQTVEVNGVEWYLIAPGEWVESTFTALVYPTDTAPEGVSNGRWIEVNLYEQTISVYQDNRLLFATLTSTGIAGWWTQPGLFQVTEKLQTTPMSGSFEANFADYYYIEDVPWTMYFDQARALHGAYWHNLFGYEQSHGCVNLSPGDARWLYSWAGVGDYVYVWDPSGQTPTDPTIYTAGGA